MRAFLNVIRFIAGLVFYLLSGLAALLAFLALPDIVTIILGVEPEYEDWELLFNIRWGLSFGSTAFVLYWIGRFLTGHTLFDIWWEIRWRIRRPAR